MNRRTLQVLFTLFTVVGVVYLMLPEDLLARAGGGGSYSGGGGSFHSSYSSSSGGGGEAGGVAVLWTLIITVVSSIASFFAGLKVKGMIQRKNKRARALLEKIDDTDPVWDREAIRARIEEIYFAVQDAWTRRNQDIAKEYMSERLYKKHKAQTDAMIADGLINKLQRINLEDVMIIGVFDSKDDEKDRLKAVIFGGMVDFMWDEKSETIINGSTDYSSFIEIWNFVREGDEWVLDEIEQRVDSQSVKSAKVYSHLFQRPAA